MERLRYPSEEGPTFDPVFVETLNGIEAAKLELDARGESLSDRHDRLTSNLSDLQRLIESVAKSGDAERIKTLKQAAEAVESRMQSLRDAMETVIAEIDAIDEHLDALVRLPTPINE